MKKASGYWYILDQNHNVIPAPLTVACEFKWGQGSYERCTVGKYNKDGYYVSTVFLAFDPQLGRSLEPVVFETMYSMPDDPEPFFERYSTWAEALMRHMELVEEFLAKDLEKFTEVSA